MSFRVSPLALGQSYDCPNASEATLKNLREIIVYRKPKHEFGYFWECTLGVQTELGSPVLEEKQVQIEKAGKKNKSREEICYQMKGFFVKVSCRKCFL